jgi:ABC-2 type transport system permease protein
VIVALALAIAADALTLLITRLWYSGRGITFDLGADGVAAPLAGALPAAALAAAIGVGAGALLRRQGATVALILVWLLIGEAAVGAIGDNARFAPGHALAAVVAAHSRGSTNTLGIWAGVATALVYAIVFVAAGFALANRADVPAAGD